jgi:ankyrin repeat protein
MNQGQIPLYTACRNENSRYVELLLNHQPEKYELLQLKVVGHTPLHYACCYSRNDQIVQLLLRYGNKLNINASERRYGCTSLHLLCFQNDYSYNRNGKTILSILKQLLQQPSIMIHHRNHFGNTALEEAQDKLTRTVEPEIRDVYCEIIRLLENWDSLRRFHAFRFMMQVQIMMRAEKEQGRNVMGNKASSVW